MTISRIAVATYLHSQFSSLAAAVAQSSTDASATGYGPDIENALRKLGKTESELALATVADGSRDALFALAEYYAARRFWRQLSDRANVVLGGETFNYTAVLTNAKAMMDDAARRCAVLGYDTSGQGWSVGWLNLDYLEPDSRT